jgi:hypothetical protein
MKKLLAAMLAALLMVGCGEEQKPEDSNDTENNASALTPPVVQPIKAPFVDKWAEWEADPEPYGGLEILAKIKEAKESGDTSLDLRDLQISDLTPLKGLTNLETLWLRNNKISDLSPLKGLTNLEALWLGGNQITDVSPLKELTNLKVLRLGGNQITDVSPFKGLTNLRVLVLTKNKISDLSPLKGLMNLKELWLGGNPIPKDQKAILRKALPNCDISF